MMIGTRDRLRISRQTSTPDSFGNIRSSSTRSGRVGVEHLQRLDAVARHLHEEALALQPDDERLHERLFVLDDEHGRLGFGHCPCSSIKSGAAGDCHLAGRRGQAQPERRPLALA